MNQNQNAGRPAQDLNIVFTSGHADALQKTGADRRWFALPDGNPAPAAPSEPATSVAKPARNWLQDAAERVTQRLNLGLNGGGCPGAGALGECAAVYEIGSNDGASAWLVAEIYLWTPGESLAAATLAEWIEACGGEDLCISHVLHDPGNETFDGRCSDGVRHFRAEFRVKQKDKAIADAIAEGWDAPKVPSASVQLEQAARQIAIQSGADANEFVEWLLAGGFVEMVLSHFKAPAAREPLNAAARDGLAELERATRKFPTWPTDPLHAVAVLGEEFGELTKDVLQLTYEPHKTSRENVQKEAMQTAAMALRFLMSIDRYQYAPGEQHNQSGATSAKGGR